ncbi:MAG TPA: M3 family metallopeptidase [Acidimicrobiia bacterium]|nr:M3 family metallopeptidase [Acidimicrobiia bacterium]
MRPMPEYALLTPKDVETGIDRAVAQAEAVITKMVDFQGERTFENTLRPLDHTGDILAHAGHDYTFMGYVHTDKAVRSAAKAGEEKLGKWAADLFFRDDIYAAVQEFAVTEEAAALEGEQARLLEFVQRDLRHAGHQLDPETRERVQQLTQRGIELGVRFQQNIDEWEDYILATRDDLEGMPDSWIDNLEVDDDSKKYKVTIDYPDMIPFVENSPRRDLREQLRFKYLTVAVEENRKILEEALEIRQEIAEAFGQPTWAHHRLEDRMAKTPERVTEFYSDLAEGLKARGLQEVAAVSKLLEADTGDTVVRGWDWGYYDTQQRKTDYGVDNFEVAKYFPLPQVLEGMFALTSEMLGITFEEVESFDTWHDDVQYFAIKEASTGEEISRFYLDLFPREGKYGHAAEFPLIPSRWLEDGSYQNPTCAMVANFTKPAKEAPSLLQHSEVETLFHEFGHVLHQNLGRTDLARFSGTNTERDFVEAPSQIMENWIWDADVLRRFARHYETGEPIPDELVDQLVAARDLNKGRFYLTQMTYGWWDQQIHAGPDRDLDDILLKGYEIALLPYHEGTFALASFGHLMGGYDAAYYGYMWSQVFGDDMFSRFEAEGVTNPEVGMAYRREVLGKGGALDADDILVNFLGREPNNEAFLRKLGIEGTD